MAGFGSQFAGWGAINAILAAFGLSSTKRNLAQQGRGEISAEKLARQTKNFERLVLLNAELDAGYIAAGAWLATQPPKQGNKLEESVFHSGMVWVWGSWLKEPFFSFGISCCHYRYTRGGMHDLL